MSQREYNDDRETRPSFDQISLRRIHDELSKDIALLKHFEVLLNDRMTAQNLYISSMGPKLKKPSELSLLPDAGINTTIDSLYNYLEQVSYLCIHDSRNYFSLLLLRDTYQSINQCHSNPHLIYSLYQTPLGRIPDQATTSFLRPAQRLARLTPRRERTTGGVYSGHERCRKRGHDGGEEGA